MSNDNWEFLVGFSAMIFAGYPMVKDVINKEPNAIFAIIMSMFFAAIVASGFLLAIKGTAPISTYTHAKELSP